LQHVVVARNLALDGKPARNPPHRRVKTQERHRALLKQVRPVIPALNVGQFMPEDWISLSGVDSSSMASGSTTAGRR
jgi:hypothetical protein